MRNHHQSRRQSNLLLIQGYWPSISEQRVAFLLLVLPPLPRRNSTLPLDSPEPHRSLPSCHPREAPQPIWTPPPYHKRIQDLLAWATLLQNLCPLPVYKQPVPRHLIYSDFCSSGQPCWGQCLFVLAHPSHHLPSRLLEIHPLLIETS